MDLGNIESLAYSIPEILLGVAVVGILMLDLVIKRKEVLGLIALFVVTFATIAASTQGGGDQGWLFNRMSMVRGTFLGRWRPCAFSVNWVRISPWFSTNAHPTPVTGITLVKLPTEP